jgi:hypothetical protein
MASTDLSDSSILIKDALGRTNRETNSVRFHDLLRIFDARGYPPQALDGLYIKLIRLYGLCR